MLEELTIDSFMPHVGTSFWVELPNGSRVELRLSRAMKVMESELARLNRHPFSLFFDGPKSILLQQQIYHVSHAAMAEMDIFIVPIGQSAETYQYEVVFT